MTSEGMPQYYMKLTCTRKMKENRKGKYQNDHLHFV